MTRSVQLDVPENQTRAGEMQATLDTADAQSGARVWFFAADGDADEEGLDAIAGCEFVDDRIRLPE